MAHRGEGCLPREDVVDWQTSYLEQGLRHPNPRHKIVKMVFKGIHVNSGAFSGWPIEEKDTCRERM